MKHILNTGGCIILLCCAAIFVWKVNLSLPSSEYQQPYNTINHISSIAIIIIPFISAISVAAFGLIQKKRYGGIRKTYSVMYFSSLMFVAMLVFWLTAELSLYWRVNVRLDIFVFMLAFLLQLYIVSFSADRFNPKKKYDFQQNT